jgi:hypothetical protein
VQGAVCKVCFERAAIEREEHGIVSDLAERQ